MKKVVGIDVVEDRTAASRCDEGFLRLRRLRIANVYEDGTRSAPYACDVMTRRHADAVAVALYDEDAEGRVLVLLREGLRPPVTLRATRTDLVQPDARSWLLLPEVVAGVLEDEDVSHDGLLRRAQAEIAEEAGLAVPPDAIALLGAAFFPAPGAAEERVHVVAAPFDRNAPRAPTGDGSPMEEGGQVIVLPLDEAIRRCRRGDVPDAKTEIALLRLADHLGYSPHHGRRWADVEAGATPSPARLAWLLGRDEFSGTSPADRTAG